jgi:pentatricopeptide repeat protein
MQRLTREPSDPSTGRIRAEGPNLVLETPWGEKYGVIPLAGNKFILEDSHEELRFAWNAEGSLEQVFTESTLTHTARQLFDDGDIERALAVFESAVIRFPDSPDALESLAEAYAKMGDLEKACELYGKVLERDPGRREAADKKKELELKRNPVTVAPDILRRYTGEYEDFQVSLEKDVLYGQRQGDSRRVRLIAMTQDRFLGEGMSYPHFRFIMTSSGKAVALELIFEDGRSVRVDRTGT